MVVVAMLVTLRSVAKNVLETCCMPYITGAYTAFTDDSSDSSGDVWDIVCVNIFELSF